VSAIPESVRKALRARRMEERVAAVEALAHIDPAESTPILVGALRDRYHYVGWLAAKILGQRCDPETVPALVECFAWMCEEGKTRDPGCRIRVELATMLGNLGYTEAAEVLAVGLRTVQMEMDGPVLVDTALRLRGCCALALSQIRPPGALLEITLLLFGTVRTADGYVEVRAPEEAATALGYWGDPAAILPLAAILGRPALATPEVVASCMDAIVELQAPEATSLLAPYLQGSGAAHGGDTAFLCARAALALARTRRPETLSILEACLGSTADESCETVAIALASLRSDEARDALLRASSHPRSSVRAATAAGLALFPDEETRAVLQRMAASDRSAQVRRAASTALR
jgi:HEAT repeat protein